jgi:hypothetical protein
MLKLLQTFLEIALWRKGPQDLPASGFLAALVLTVYLGVGLLGVRLFRLSLHDAAVMTCVTLLMVTAWLWLVLLFFGRRHRFVQTITATLGVAVLIALLDVAVRSVQLALGLGANPSGSWLLARFLIIALVMGRIFMQALDRGLLTGVALTIAIIQSTQAVTLMTLDTLKGS